MYARISAGNIAMQGLGGEIACGLCAGKWHFANSVCISRAIFRWYRGE